MSKLPVLIKFLKRHKFDVIFPRTNPNFPRTNPNFPRTNPNFPRTDPNFPGQTRISPNPSPFPLRTLPNPEFHQFSGNFGSSKNSKKRKKRVTREISRKFLIPEKSAIFEVPKMACGEIHPYYD